MQKIKYPHLRPDLVALENIELAEMDRQDRIREMPEKERGELSIREFNSRWNPKKVDRSNEVVKWQTASWSREMDLRHKYQ